MSFKMRPLRPPSRQRSRRSMESVVDWGAFSTRVGSLAAVLEEAYVLLQEDDVNNTTGFRSATATDKPRISAAERKRRIQQALKSLKSARIQLQPVCSKLEGLQQTFQGRESIMTRLESSAADLEEALSKLQAAQEDKDKAVAEMVVLREKTRQNTEEVQKLQRILTNGAAEYKSAVDKAQTAEAWIARLTAERDASRLQLEEAQQQLAGVKERASKASEGAQRHQQAMAKLTADNLVLLLRLRQCEAGLAAATSERDALRLEVTEKRGPWFEEVGESVEQRVGQALARVAVLEQQLEEAVAARESAASRAEAEKQELHALLVSFEARVAELSTEVSAAQQQASSAAEHEKAAWERQEEAMHAEQRVQAENRVLHQQLRIVQEEARLSKVAEEAALDKVAGLQAQIDNLSRDVALCQVQMRESLAAFEAQKVVNSELMQRKQDVEWQLLNALSQTNRTPQAPYTPPQKPRPALQASDHLAADTANLDKAFPPLDEELTLSTVNAA